MKLEFGCTAQKPVQLLVDQMLHIVVKKQAQAGSAMAVTLANKSHCKIMMIILKQVKGK